MILNISLRTTTTPEKPPVNELMERVGAWDGNSVDWGSIETDGLPITNTEVSALKKSNKTKTINAVRAMRVKYLMSKGKTVTEIYRALRKYGPGYGESSIKHDHAALSPFQKR